MQPETEVDLHCELWRIQEWKKRAEGLYKNSPTQKLTIYVDLATFLALKRPVTRFTVPMFYLSFVFSYPLHWFVSVMFVWRSPLFFCPINIPVVSPLFWIHPSTTTAVHSEYGCPWRPDSAQAEVCAALLVALLFSSGLFFSVCTAGWHEERADCAKTFFTAATGTVWRQTYRHSDTWRWYWPRARPPCIPIIPVRL